MPNNDLRRRKSGSTQGEEEETTENKNEPQPLPSSFRTKSFICLVAFILATFLYNSGYLLRWKKTDVFDSEFEVLRLPADMERRDAVVNAFKHAWLAYERDAMGADEYHPISKKGTNLTSAGGIGYTIVDSLDTMQLMGLVPEYERARKWLTNSLSFDRNGNYNTFEITIRVLGGLLSSYSLSGGDALFLNLATDLASRILPAFDTPSGLPATEINLGKRKKVDDPNNVVSTSEATSVQLELRYLSWIGGEEDFWDKGEHVMEIVKKKKLPSGLATIYLGTDSGEFLTSQIRLGSRGDSYYEYLLKQYLQTNQTEPVYRDMYESTMTAVHGQLMKKGINKNLTYFVEFVPQRGTRGRINWYTEYKQDHLVCFFGGNLMLGAVTTGALVPRVSIPPKKDELSESGWRDWNTGKDVIETCVDTYRGTATGLGAEIVHFWSKEDEERGNVKGERDWYIKGLLPAGKEPPYDARYILRPETIESLFIAYRLTGEEKYREYAWDIFQAIEKYCRVETGGYVTILNVDDLNSKQEDRMETFMMSETLKYLFLLFSDSNVVPLSKYVFNTEAHPLPIFTPHARRAFSIS